MVYETFFGMHDPENALNYLSEGTEDEQKEPGFKRLKAAAAAEGGGEPSLDSGRVAWAQSVYDKCFKTETERLLSMEDLWMNEDGTVKRKKPVAIGVASSLGLAAGAEVPMDLFAELDAVEDQEQMTLRQATLLFLKSGALLQGSADRGFDKDDSHACDFVIAACNLRGACFHMDALTPFKAKEMAGNIIAAIASTNAIIAAMIVLEGIKVLEAS